MLAHARVGHAAAAGLAWLPVRARGTAECAGARATPRAIARRIEHPNRVQSTGGGGGGELDARAMSLRQSTGARLRPTWPRGALWPGLGKGVHARELWGLGATARL